MKIERWEHTPRTQQTRQTSPPYNPTKIQVLILQANGQLAGGPILIPASTVYDPGTLPPGLGPNDFTFTGQDLVQYTQEYWATVG